MDNRPIGVFDSGLGGLSVLSLARRVLPSERFIYLGDNANAPYGEKTEEEIRALTLGMAERLLRRGIKALLIACNTATSAAADTLRARLSLPIIAMEPALKPAQAVHGAGQILVLATPATLRLPKFEQLMAKYGEGAVRVPVTGVVELVEEGKYDAPEMDLRLRQILDPLLRASTDAVVLGCTHYIFARPSFRRVLGEEIALLDGNEGTVRRLAAVLRERDLLGQGEGSAELHTTGDEAKLLPLMRRMAQTDLPA